MNRWVLCASLMVFHQFHGANAQACGATSEVVESVLPTSDATEVPLDAALLAASNGRAITAMMLRRVDDAVESGERGEADAGFASAGDAAPEEAEVGEGGAREVEVKVECYLGPGALCVGKPASPLRPDTTYEWSVSTEQAGLPLLATESRRFTTGRDLAGAARPKVRIELTQYERYNGHPCGLTGYAQVAMSVTGLVGPQVVHARPLYTDGRTQLVAVLTPDAPDQSVSLYDMLECSTLKGFDVTGRPMELGEVCPEDMGVGTPALGDSSAPAGSGQQTNAESAAPSESGSSNPDEVNGGEEISRRSVASDADSGCAIAGASGVTRRAGGAAWVLVAVGCLTFARTRLLRRAAGRAIAQVKGRRVPE